MNSDIKILIGDNSFSFTLSLIRSLKSRKFNVSNCSNSCLFAEIERFHPDLLVLYDDPDTETQAKQVDNLIEKFPLLKIIILSFSHIPSSYSKLLKKNIAAYILMPVTPADLERVIIEKMYLPKSEKLQQIIPKYVSAAFIPSNKKHFEHLCAAVTLTILNPGLLTRIKTGLYSETADYCKVNINVLQHSLRKETFRQCSAVFSSKFLSNRLIFKKDDKITVRELICLISDSFIDKIGLDSFKRKELQEKEEDEIPPKENEQLNTADK